MIDPRTPHITPQPQTNFPPALHTTNDCSMSVKRKETGTVSAKNCYNGTDDNAGCGVTGSSDTYGQAFNNKGGGIMAMELRSAGIRMWQFLRSEIPSDITAQTPDPSTWGEALADFPSTDCDIGSHFRNQSIIVNIEICGSWAGATSVYRYVLPLLLPLFALFRRRRFLSSFSLLLVFVLRSLGSFLAFLVDEAFCCHFANCFGDIATKINVPELAPNTHKRMPQLSRRRILNLAISPFTRVNRAELHGLDLHIGWLVGMLERVKAKEEFDR